MYEEMKRYHREFLKIFDNVDEGRSSEYAITVKQRQYRMGYGLFISELAGMNALEKEQLHEMVQIVMEKLVVLTDLPDKTKTVEEFIDCLVRLTSSLKVRSPKFFESVKADMCARIMSSVDTMIARKAGERQSLSNKGRFGLMDLKDNLA
jgi:hypothetical protein